MFNKKLDILVLGADGMLGHDVHEMLSKMAATPKSKIGVVTGLTHKDISLDVPYALSAYFMKSIHYDFCINCAAFTDTTAAEGDGEHQSYIMNALVPKYIAEACEFKKTHLIHVSTDYVFSEFSEHEDNTLRRDEFPTNQYGLHKLLGEQNVRLAMPSGRWCIARTSWLYGQHKSKSFVHKFVRNMKKALGELVPGTKNPLLAVPDDQMSIPTSTERFCTMLLRAIYQRKRGIVNICGGCTGIPNMASRFEFADMILNWYTGKMTRVVPVDATIVPIKTEFKPIHYPLNSALSCYDKNTESLRKGDGDMDNWKCDLFKFLDQYGEQIWNKA